MLIKPNPKFLICVNNISEGLLTLGELNIPKIYSFPEQVHNWKKEDSLFYTLPYYKGSLIRPQNHLALFDIDWTITFAQKKLKPHWNVDDIELLPNRQKILENIVKLGYTLIFVTNQKVVAKDLKKIKQAQEERVKRIQNFITKLQLPCWVFVATGDDNYRKPNTGIWTKIKSFIPNIQYAFYVGDALGRPQDFSDSDKKFPENIGIPYFTPEDIFPVEIVKPPLGNKYLVITVGAQGTGKSTYTETYFPEYYMISSDKLKSNKKKILSELEKQLKLKTSPGIVIDATNPTQEGREVYYALGSKYGYKIIVLYFVRDGYGWNKLRTTTRVPDIAYNIFYSKLIQPTSENTPGKLVLIN